MKRIIILLILIISCCATAFSQEVKAKLLGESGDGKIVKLMWFLRVWDKDMIGFNIKRKDEKGNWILINNQTIIPELSVAKKLDNIETDAGEITRLGNKLQVLLQNKNVKEVPTADYIKKLTSDPTALKGVSFAIGLDYDLALMNGFGLVDRTVTSGKYQYGLFFVRKKSEDNVPAATYDFEYGVKTNLSPAISISVSPMNKKIVQLIWSAPFDKIAEVHAAGFNVYKQIATGWKKLNEGPVAVYSDTKNGYTFFDTTASYDVNTKYAVTLASMFKNEGEKAEFVFDPMEHPLEYKVPELIDIASAGENFEKGREVKWEFPKEFEKYVKSYVIEKANLPGRYMEVLSVNDIQARSADDNTFSPPASYLKYRIKIIYKDDSRLIGNEKLYYFLPVIYAPKPEHLAAKPVRDNKKVYVDLSWDPKAPNDSLTFGYQLYVTDRYDGKMYLQGSIPIFSANKYRYEIEDVSAGEYKFVVAAVSKYKAVGHYSDTVKVYTPSIKLPIPSLYPKSLDSSRVTLTWDYDNIPDLKGFRLYQNGNMVQSEYELKKDARIFTTPKLKIGSTYNFKLQAVSVDGVESDVSMPQDIYIYNQIGYSKEK